MLLNEPFKDLNAEYFARRTDYVNTLASPDYVNVISEETPAAGDERKSAYVNVDPERQTAAYRGSRAGQTNGQEEGRQTARLDMQTGQRAVKPTNQSIR